MFDIGWSEIMVIAVVALVIIGPKDLPSAIYTLGKWVRKARFVARDFQTHIDDMMREAELDELKKQALKARDLNIAREVEKTIDPTGDVKAAFELPPEASGVAGYHGSPPEEEQPRPATEPPVTLPAGTTPSAAAPEPEKAPEPATAAASPPPATPDKTV
ncbi:Sec-independent protein translocase protein TatB [Azospirillum sp.]|uniref:Sec-independent protein translocase protein TatB n=1 Tax=Azospirillum sp. TaxID=34012 RepID=UPI002D369C78|nr:Sec-independent protein translocase protein TatB [Azospirillum sp.]HYD67650.1 Sec-independent protein translocase protein TatB [Azospirillum sp.]